MIVCEGAKPVIDDDLDKDRGFFSRSFILTVTLIAAALIILNLILLFCYVKRRGARKQQLGNYPIKTLLMTP